MLVHSYMIERKEEMVMIKIRFKNGSEFIFSAFWLCSISSLLCPGKEAFKRGFSRVSIISSPIEKNPPIVGDRLSFVAACLFAEIDFP